MAVTILKPIDCPVCEEQITGNYCSNCGNHITGKRVKFSTAVGDIINSFFALDRSVTNNFKEMLFRPGRIINLYLDGYRKFYFSPGRYLLIAAAVLALNFWVSGGQFLAIEFNVSNGPGQFLFLFFFLPIFTFCSYLIYFRRKRNFFEHLVINAYAFGYWLIWFSLLSMVLFKANMTMTKDYMILVFIGCVVTWTSLSFSMPRSKRFFVVVVHILLLFAMITGLLFLIQFLSDK